MIFLISVYGYSVRVCNALSRMIYSHEDSAGTIHDNEVFIPRLGSNAHHVDVPAVQRDRSDQYFPVFVVGARGADDGAHYVDCVSVGVGHQERPIFAFNNQALGGSGGQPGGFIGESVAVHGQGSVIVPRVALGRRWGQ